VTEDEIDTLVSKVSLSIVLSYKKSEENKRYNFALKGRKRVWNISLDFPNDFPKSFPIVKLLDMSEVGKVAHVNSVCTVCIEESDSVLINHYEAVKVLEHYLEDIKTSLDNFSLRAYQYQLMDEYEGYFNASLVDSVNSFYKATETLEYVYLKVTQVLKNKDIFNRAQRYDYPALILDMDNLAPKNYSNVKNINATTIKAIHIPLFKQILPPSNAEKISLSYLYNIIKNITSENRNILDIFLTKEKEKRQFFVLLSLPRTENERTQLLLEFSSKNKLKHPLTEPSDDWFIDLYFINRHNQEYLLERGGAENSLQNKHVTIVGCGSVGGEIAYMLAKAGIGNLTLVDNDKLHPDNIYRHRLGGNMINYLPNKKTGKVKQYSKTLVLKNSLEKDLPHINVDIRSKKFEQVLDEDFVNESDMIIVAIGSPMPSFTINEELKKLGINKVIFCWNEPASYGGHIVQLNLQECCLQCLYTSDDTGELGISKLALVKPSPKISKNLTGCGGVFTPFSYLDSSQTALLASKQCVRALQTELDSTAISWKDEGNGMLETTQRYEDINTVEMSSIQCSVKCKVCNNG